MLLLKSIVDGVLIFCHIAIRYGRDSAIGISTGYGLDGRGVGVRVPVGARFFAPPRRPDRFWGQPSVLSNGHRGLFPRG
jgi:hypothetical protein